MTIEYLSPKMATVQRLMAAVVADDLDQQHLSMDQIEIGCRVSAMQSNQTSAMERSRASIHMAVAAAAVDVNNSLTLLVFVPSSSTVDHCDRQMDRERPLDRYRLVVMQMMTMVVEADRRQ
jgi:hypothetical protein